MREPQKREALWLPFSTRLPVGPRIPAELDQPRLVRVQFQLELGQPFGKLPQKPVCFVLTFEPNHKVSSPREFRPEALSEPYMNLSAHTAPTMEPRRTPICQCANNRESRRDIRAIQCVALRR